MVELFHFLLKCIIYIFRYGVTDKLYDTLLKRYVKIKEITNKKYKNNFSNGLYQELDGDGFILSSGVCNKMYYIYY